MDADNSLFKRLSQIYDQLCGVDDSGIVQDVILDFLLWPYSEQKSLRMQESIVCRLHHRDRLGLLFSFQDTMNHFYEKQPLRDIIGQFYCLNCAYKGKGMGQYFTPDELSDLVAAMTIPDTSVCKFGEKVLDPTCGSGSLLLAAARRYPYFLFFGSDISEKCCKMAVYNLITNGLSGEICQLDCLRNQFFQVFNIFMRQNCYGDNELYFVQSSDCRDSLVHLKTPEESKKAALFRKLKYAKL